MPMILFQQSILANPRGHEVSRDVALNAVLRASAERPVELRAYRQPARPKRATIWDLNANMHCSIIGTCLSSAELKKLLIKLRVKGADDADDHDVHMLGVLLAGRPQSGAKILQKALDRRHESAIKACAKVCTSEDLTALWDDALKRGDIPGFYWAVLTHPLSDDHLVRRVFGDVHMLSHLVGAANRADIRRLRALEEQNEALTEKVERQQRHLRDGFVDRDHTIQSLRTALADAVNGSSREQAASTDDEALPLQEVIADLSRRLSRESAHRAQLQARCGELSGQLRNSQAAEAAAQHEIGDLGRQLAKLEDHAAALLSADQDITKQPAGLDGATVLYVGGRTNQIPRLRQLVESLDGIFLHHDGGLEQSTALLPGLVARADLTLFPTDCVSHNAMNAVKRVCGQIGRTYQPLRSNSIASLLDVLAEGPVRGCTHAPSA